MKICAKSSLFRRENPKGYSVIIRRERRRAMILGLVTEGECQEWAQKRLTGDRPHRPC